MLSRIVIVGRAPKELVDLIGYNPVIEIQREQQTEKIVEILSHIEDFQCHVDKNRETALKTGDWNPRAKMIKEWLKQTGYIC